MKAIWTLYCHHPTHGTFPVGHFETPGKARGAREEYLKTNKKHAIKPIEGWIYADCTFTTKKEEE